VVGKSNDSYHDYILKNRWEKEYFPLSGKSDFRNFWNESLGNGVFSYRSFHLPKSFFLDKEALKWE
jgi:hypothetical protein